MHSDLEQFEKWMKQTCASRFPRTSLHQLFEAISYSLFSGGKRFRPLLAIEVAKAFGKGPEFVYPWAMAVEMIHTYSLIHDDLPSMDDDKERRGKPTNHIVYGESTALLAGDALLTEAFLVIADFYPNSTAGIQLVQLLAQASGCLGMVGGQAEDLSFQAGLKPSTSQVSEMHRKKTGALIRVSVQGSARVCLADKTQEKCLVQFGELLGEAFQVADDLLDSREEDIEEGSLIESVGKKAAFLQLESLTAQSFEILKDLHLKSEGLLSLTEQNLDRARILS